MSETPESVPQLCDLAAYLHYQYPATKGDIKLYQLCSELAHSKQELDDAIKKKNQCFVALSHFVTHYEVADYSEATFDEIEKIAVSLWGVVEERDKLPNAASHLQHRQNRSPQQYPESPDGDNREAIAPTGLSMLFDL